MNKLDPHILFEIFSRLDEADLKNFGACARSENLHISRYLKYAYIILTDDVVHDITPRLVVGVCICSIDFSNIAHLFIETFRHIRRLKICTTMQDTGMWKQSCMFLALTTLTRLESEADYKPLFFETNVLSTLRHLQWNYKCPPIIQDSEYDLNKLKMMTALTRLHFSFGDIVDNYHPTRNIHIPPLVEYLTVKVLRDRRTVYSFTFAPTMLRLKVFETDCHYVAGCILSAAPALTRLISSESILESEMGAKNMIRFPPSSHLVSLVCGGTCPVKLCQLPLGLTELILLDKPFTSLDVDDKMRIPTGLKSIEAGNKVHITVRAWKTMEVLGIHVHSQGSCQNP
jgi:hypothetical protein